MLAKAFAKVRGFFLTTKFFSKFFFEKIFQRSETGTGSPSRSLSTAKVRYKATPEKPETSRSLCQCFTAFLSRKRMQNYCFTTYLPNVNAYFFATFCILIAKSLICRHVLQQGFSAALQWWFMLHLNFITRTRMRARFNIHKARKNAP